MAAASSYVLQGAYVSPWSGPGTLGVTNLDTSGKVVTVTTVGAAMTPGETYTLSTYGDAVTIDLGTVASFSIAASAYPATILLLVTPVSGVPVVTANPAVGSTVGRRYLGKVTITANAQGAASGTFPVTLQQADRYLSVIQPSTWRGVSGTSTAQTNDPAISPAIATATGGSAGPLVTLPVIPDLTLLWEVAFSTSGATPSQSFTFYLFADQGPEVVQVEAGLSNVPVNVAGLNGAAIAGQATSLFSFPVVIASDQSAVRVVTNGQGTSLASGASSQAPQANTFGAGQIPAGSRIYAAFGHFVNRTSGTIAEMEVALVDGLGGHHYFGWSFAVGTGVGPAVNVVYPIGIIPAGLSLSGTWVVVVTTSAHSGSPLLDWNAGVVFGP